ncbi:carbohydrate ABC transporter permease [Deefgea sp. CFH1-16]|uniref:carbohydrate ABC transporter permease n=1 Tax=Deefgea sp. CFH1-16 TaxID=2675457 RepID=UPI0019402393|nr:carbohydrate ABC transporter permease [Deefgea sp. CFH1-16]
MTRKIYKPLSAFGVHCMLGGYTLLALFPIVLILINAFKTKAAIFDNPLAFPTAETFFLGGFEKVIAKSHFMLYFGNSLTVTLASLALILLFGAMAAWALSEYKFRGNRMLAIYMMIGIMVPIRLGTVSILELIVQLNPDQHPNRLGAGLHRARLAAGGDDFERVYRANPKRAQRSRAL